MKGFCGHLKDESILKKTASGGFSYALCERILSNGGVCYGASYTPDFKGAEYIRVSDFNTLDKILTSKYVKATLSDEILNFVLEDLKSDKEVLFTGLPCDLYKLSEKLEQENIDTKKLLRVDLKCNGPVIPEGFFEYTKMLEHSFGKKIKSIITPYKNPSWYPVCIKVIFEDNSSFIEELAKTEYGILFDYLKDEKCYYCAYKGDNHKSDITISNFWGVNVKDPSFSYYGTSYAYVYTKKGEDFLKTTDSLILFEDDVEKRLEGLPSYSTTPKKIKQCEKLKKNFKRYGLVKAIKIHNSFINRLIRKF